MKIGDGLYDRQSDEPREKGSVLNSGASSLHDTAGEPAPFWAGIPKFVLMRQHRIPLLLGVIGLVLCAAAMVRFGQFRTREWEEVPVADATVEIRGERVTGTITLPGIYRLHWDGRPPRAEIVRSDTGEVMGPSLLSEQSLERNHRGTFWGAAGDCRFVIDRATYEGLEGVLRIRYERLHSRAPFYLLLICGIVSLLGAFLVLQVRQVRAAPYDQRRTAQFAAVRNIGFVAISLAALFAFFPGVPVHNHWSSDAHNIHSFAAGRQAPQAFSADPFLSETRNYSWYTPLYVKFVEAFGAFGMHYATSAAALAFIACLIGLFGYFRLFRTISHSDAFALCAAIGLMLMSERYPANENWNLLLVLPRTVFSAILPWVVLAAIRCAPHQRRWWLAGTASGLLIYVHPVSAPALTGAVLSGLVIAGTGPFHKRLGWGVVAAAAAIAVMLPYAAVYVSKYQGTVVTDPSVLAQAREITRERLYPTSMNAYLLMREIAGFTFANYRFWIAAPLTLWLFAARPKSSSVRMLFGMGLGFAIVVFAIPIVDLQLARKLGRLPFQVDLFRNFRYADVFLVTIVGLAVREMRCIVPQLFRFSRHRNSAAETDSVSSGHLGLPDRTGFGQWGAAAGVVLICLFYGKSCTINSLQLIQRCRANAQLLDGSASSDSLEMHRVLQALRRPDEVILGGIRWRQLHMPVGYTRKDLGALAYSNPTGLIAARNVLDRIEELKRQGPITMSIARSISEAAQADILVFEREELSDEFAMADEIIYLGSKFVLLRVGQSSESERPVSELAGREVHEQLQ